MTKKKKRRNPVHKKGKNQHDQDESHADNDEILGQANYKCPHETKAVKPSALQNRIPHVKLGKCSACSEKSSSDVGVCICLRCGNLGCDRNTEDKHSLAHYQSTPSHSVTVHLQTWIVWCYQCDNEVTVTPDSDLHNCIKLLLKAMKLDSPEDHQPQMQKTNIWPSGSPENETKLAKFSLSSAGKIKGLTNLGNTCFFNAVMQNLCQTDLLRVALTCAMKEEFSHAIRSNNKTQQQITVTAPAGSLTTALWKVLRDVQAGSSHGAINPKQLFNEVCKKAPRFRGFRQQDSQELLRYLLDSVRTEELRRVKHSLLKSFGVNQASDAKLLDDDQRARVREYGQLLGAPVVDCVFAGELVSIVICQECNEESRVYEMFLDLSLPLSNPKKQQPFYSRGKSSKQMKVQASEPTEDHAVNTAKQNKGPSKHHQKIERKAQRKKNKGGKSHGGHQRGGMSSRKKSRSEDEGNEAAERDPEMEGILNDEHQEIDGEVSKPDVSEDDNDISIVDYETEGKRTFAGFQGKDEEISKVDDERDINTAVNDTNTELCIAEDYQGKEGEMSNIDVKKNERKTSTAGEETEGKETLAVEFQRRDEETTKLGTSEDDVCHTVDNDTKIKLYVAEDYQGKEREISDIDFKNNERKPSTAGKETEEKETLVVDFQRRDEETSTLGTSGDVACHVAECTHINCEEERASIDVEGEGENSEVCSKDMVGKNHHKCGLGEKHGDFVVKNVDNTKVGENENNDTENNESDSGELEVDSVECETKNSELESWMADEFLEERQESEGDYEFDWEEMDLEIDNNSNEDVGMLVSDLESDEDIDDDCDGGVSSGNNNNSRRYVRVTSRDLEKMNKNFCVCQNRSSEPNDVSLPAAETNRFHCLRTSVGSDDDNGGDNSTLEKSDEGISSESRGVERDQTGSSSKTQCMCSNSPVSDNCLKTLHSFTGGPVSLPGEEENDKAILSRGTLAQRTGCDVTLDGYKTNGLESCCSSEVSHQISLPWAENALNQASVTSINGEPKQVNDANNVSRITCQGSVIERKHQATNDTTNHQFSTKCCVGHGSTATVYSITRQETCEERYSVDSRSCNLGNGGSGFAVTDCVTRHNAKPVSNEASEIGELKEGQPLHIESDKDVMICSGDKEEEKSLASTEMLQSKTGNVFPGNALGGNAFEGYFDGSKRGSVNREQEDSERNENSSIEKECENHFRTNPKRDLYEWNDGIHKSDANSSVISCNKNEQTNCFAKSEGHVEPQNCESTSAECVKKCAECVDTDTSFQQGDNSVTEKNVIIECNKNETGVGSPDPVLKCNQLESLESQSSGDMNRCSSRAGPLELEPESHNSEEQGERSLTLGSFYYPTPGECSVTSCLSQFCIPEMLDGGNKFACEVCSERCHGKDPRRKEADGQMDDNNDQDRCSSEDDEVAGATAGRNSKNKSELSSCRPAVYTVARKQMLISSAPPVLTLHLKRFQHVGMGLRKIPKHVDFPLLLDLAPFCSKSGRTQADSSGRVLYSLYGVVEHSGGMHGGHYTAFVKAKTRNLDEHYGKISSLDDLVNHIRDMWSTSGDQTSRARPVLSEEGQWYHVSDTHVTTVPVAKVLRSQAYMLFYERLVLAPV